MKKIWDFITVSVCLTVCILIGGLTLILPKKSFSAQENRALSVAPILSAQSLVSGKYFRQAANFFSDHIIFRSGFVRGRTVAELCIGRQEVGGVLFYGDGSLVQRGLDASEKLLIQNLDAIAKIEEQVKCVVVPRAIDAVGLTEAAGTSEAAEYFCDLAYSHFDLGGKLLSELRRANLDRRVYYATDHHLTSYGAYVAYSFLGEILGYVPHDSKEFEIQTVTSDFLGTSYSAAGLLSFMRDSVELWRYYDDDELVLTRESGEIPLYDFSFLGEKDKYRVFLGGNHGIVQVNGIGERPKLLLIKDSYANALVPFLALHFDITVVDPRYTDVCFAELAEGGEYDEILIFCGIDTLSTGNDFARFFRMGD